MHTDFGLVQTNLFHLYSTSAAHFHPHFPGLTADDVVVGTLTLVTHGARQDVHS